MTGLLARVLNMVRLGRVTAIDDSGSVQRVQVTEAGPGPDGTPAVVDNVAVLGLFGVASVPPLKSDVLVVRLFGGRSLTVAISTNHQPSRLRDLEPGDSALYDQRGAYLKMTAEGPVLDCAGLALKIRNFSTFIVEGDVQATGDMISRSAGGPVSLNTVADAYGAHKHQVLAVGSPTALTDHPLP